jgi:hypothetical protein
MSTIIRHIAYAALALAGWFAILVAMPFVGPEGRQVAVVGDSASAVRIILASGGEIVEVRRGAVIARASPAALYRGGARLVVEGRIAAGCFQPASGAAKAGA